MTVQQQQINNEIQRKQCKCIDNNHKSRALLSSLYLKWKIVS